MVVSTVVTADPINLALDKVFIDDLTNVLRVESDELREFLEQESPRGISPSSESLSGSWVNEVPAPPTDDLLATIRNTSEGASDRIRGVRPGTRTDFGSGSGLDRWVRGVIGVTDVAQRRSITFLIARSIERLGSERFRSGENVLDLDPNTDELRRGSPVFDTVRRIERGIGSITIRA